MSVVVDKLLRDTFSCFGASRVSNFHNRGINLRNPNISFSDFYLSMLACLEAATGVVL